jgi:Uma2 family endonuclease
MFADDPGRVVFPDGCYFSRETFREEDIPPRGWCRVAPDLVVEVVSPGDNAAAVRAKVRDYLAAGVGLVWVAYPDTRHVDIFRPDGTALTVQGAGVITGEDVIPGFSCPVDEFFPPAGTPAATASSGRRRR